MMNFEAFKALVDEIAAQGHDEEIAAHYAYCIGDIPITDADGNIIVLDDDGKELARLKPLKFFSTE